MSLWTSAFRRMRKFHAAQASDTCQNVNAPQQLELHMTLLSTAEPPTPHCIGGRSQVHLLLLLHLRPLTRSPCLSLSLAQTGGRVTAGSPGGGATLRPWSVCCSRSGPLTRTTAAEVSLALIHWRSIQPAVYPAAFGPQEFVKATLSYVMWEFKP